MALLRTCVLLLVCSAVFVAACHGSQSPRRAAEKKMDEKEEKKEEKMEEKKVEPKKFEAQTLTEYKDFKMKVIAGKNSITNLATLKTQTMITDEDKLRTFMEVAKAMNDTDVIQIAGKHVPQK